MTPTPLSPLACARRNARTVARAAPAARPVLGVLFEHGHGWEHLAAGLRAQPLPSVAGDHALCTVLAGALAGCQGAGAVPLDASPITHHLRDRGGIPGPVAQELALALAAADGRPSLSLTLGGLPLAVLLPGLLLLTCPDLRRCPYRRQTTTALADPGAADALGDLRLGTSSR